MRVLFVAPQAETVLRGGLWKQLHHTREVLRSKGVDAEYYTAPEGGQLTRYDLIHVIGANIGSYQLVRELSRRGLPMVVSPVFYSKHSPSFVRLAVRLQTLSSKVAKGIWTDYTFVADVCRWATMVLPNTQEEAEFLRRAFAVSSERMVVVPNGVEERFYHAQPGLFEQEYGCRNFLLYVGHFGPRKNVLPLIRAANRLGVSAVIIGDCKDQQYLQQCRREASTKGLVRIIGALPPDSELLVSAYAACSVFVLPSDYETPGIAALEAALAGARIVITKYGGTKEYFGAWAEYIEPKSEQSLVDGIQRALRKEKSPHLREHIRKNFLWTNVGEKILEVYRRVLQRT